MLTSEEKLKIIKGNKEELGRSCNNEILIIIADELIKINDYFKRVAYDKQNLKW